MNVPPIGFIGAGQMATALAKGFIGSGLVDPKKVVASDSYDMARRSFTQQTKAEAKERNADVVNQSTIIILAVKPQVLPGVLTEIEPLITGNHLIVSICAGVPLSAISAGLNGKGRLIRVMPNTPCLVGQGAMAYSMGQNTTTNDGLLIQTLLQTIGLVYQVPEKSLDAVTGLSGSGPAFVYMVIEAMADGGVREGLPRPIATALAAQCVLGSASMVLKTGEHPGLLKDKVCSPAGTTIEGVAALERNGVRNAFIQAVHAATVRSQELGGKK